LKELREQANKIENNNYVCDDVGVH